MLLLNKVHMHPAAVLPQPTPLVPVDIAQTRTGTYKDLSYLVRRAFL